MVIETKFNIGQECYAVLGKDIEKVKIIKIRVVVSNFEDENFTLYSIADKNGYSCTLPEEQICETEEQAKEKVNG